MREIDKGNGWKIREIIDPNSGERHTQYFYKGRRAPRVELVDKISRQLAGYALIEKDLRNVIIWLNEIERLHPMGNREKSAEISPDRETFNIIKGLYVASLTFYGKCFTKCEGRKVKLEQKLIDKKYQEAHENIMHMRHNFAAHSGADSFEEVKIALVLYPSKKIDDAPFIYRELMQVDFKDEGEGQYSFLNLAEHVRSKIIEKTESLERKIYEKEILPKGKNHWYRKAKKS